MNTPASSLPPFFQRRGIFEIFPSFSHWEDKKLKRSHWVLEIGPGNGEFLFFLAGQSPEKLFFVLELRRGRFRRIAERIQSENLENILAIHGDARSALPFLFPQRSLDAIYVLFPDPWPKRRHHKHRLINPHRVSEFYSLLKSGGSVWMATDFEDYAEQIARLFPESDWEKIPSISLFPTTFERRWKKMNRTISYFQFRKRS